jgi:ATP-dependent helicase/DNAse subunit B
VLPLASQLLIKRLIQETVDEAVNRGEISYFVPMQFFPGFILALRDSFAELKHAMVTTQQFTQYASTDSTGQKDLVRIYTAYQDFMELSGRMIG